MMAKKPTPKPRKKPDTLYDHLSWKDANKTKDKNVRGAKWSALGERNRMRTAKAAKERNEAERRKSPILRALATIIGGAK